MNIKYSYTPYCSSWKKYLTVLAAHHIFYFLNEEGSSSVRIPSVLYSAHNLYSEYKYNQSLEAVLKVEINGETHTIKASPSYFNWYTGYNATKLAESIGLAYYGCNDIIIAFRKSPIPLLVSSLGDICKLISLKDNYKEYKFIDVDTGKEISSKYMQHLNILDIKYVNNPQEIIDHQDEITCYHSNDVQLDNHVIEGIA
jgi:hypothetical protein